MTIKELMQALSQYDENTPVRIFDERHGHIDITEIIEFNHTTYGHYVSLT